MARSKIIPKETVISIWEDIQKGVANAVIYKRYGISNATLYRIKNKEKRYGKIIDEYLKHSSENNKPLKPAKKVPDEKLSPQAKKESILENLDNLNYETFVSILYQSFSRYYQPIVLKLIYDNFLSTDKSKDLIERTIKDIQETKNIENLYEAINTIQAVIHTQLLTPEALEKLLKRESVKEIE